MLTIFFFLETLFNAVNVLIPYTWCSDFHLKLSFDGVFRLVLWFVLSLKVESKLEQMACMDVQCIKSVISMVFLIANNDTFFWKISGEICNWCSDQGKQLLKESLNKNGGMEAFHYAYGILFVDEMNWVNKKSFEINFTNY